MYRVLLRIVFCDIWKGMKKNIGILIWSIILIIYITGIGMMRVRNIGFYMSVSTRQRMFIGIVFISILLIIRSVFSENPLRISKGIYLCPAGYKEKMKYLLLEIGMKIIIGFAMTAVILFVSVGYVFPGGDVLFHLAAVMLCFFTMLNVILSFGRGESRVYKVDEQGYRIQSKAETMLKTYWVCILILEWMLLCMCTIESFGFDWRIMAGVWFGCLIVNCIFVAKYMKKMLDEILLYENVYCQQPKEEEVLYDLV